MSRTVVGYEGEGKHRRPVYDSPPVEELGFNPPGAIERRQAADHERAGFAPGRPSPGLHRAAPRTALALVPSAEPRRSIAVTDPAPSPAPPQEEPAMAIEPPPAPPVEPRSHLEQDPPVEIPQLIVTRGDAIAALHVATTEALAAWEAWQEARHAEIRWEAACKALESAWRRTGLRGGPTSIDTALEAMKLGVELGRADTASASPDGSPNIPKTIPDELADDAPEVVTRRAEADPTAQPAAAFAAFSRDKAASAEAGPALSASQERLLRAVRKANGNLKDAAAALGITGQGVQTSLRHIGEKGGIPVELIPMLPAGYAKYRPAGL